MDVHSNAAVSGNVVDDFLSFDNMEGGGGVSLEWLSVFVEDCLNGGFPTPAPTTATHQTASPVDSQHESPKPTQATKDPTPVPSKTRTKRRKINTNQTNSLHSFHVSLSSSDPPPLLPQAYWLADSELIFPKKETENNKSPSPQLKPQGQEYYKFVSLLWLVERSKFEKGMSWSGLRFGMALDFLSLKGGNKELSNSVIWAAQSFDDEPLLMMDKVTVMCGKQKKNSSEV
ncbi:uncharacterized protein A4U43_C03F4950 [Asparagus officinalis]|uniref:Uncharacterized protein n=1 Tax=Asparagus officinalis TaxID=4686 RepID=A0A5P1F7Z9_ASPOF|nr:uncharacterized protein A4U43_C03F4950 [Asparagus officinalis]